MIKFAVIVLLATMAFAKPGGDAPCPGCPFTLTSEEDVARVTIILNESLAAVEEPHYKLGKINAASEQAVGGNLYKINADLVDVNDKTKTCDIEILRAKEVTVSIKCADEDEVKKVHEFKDKQ
uniref:Cystatin domain-containing protein n=1 Tax=Stomoxys calcitrans TaxID=35570 RepID=A0A1I8P3A5_STOCA